MKFGLNQVSMHNSSHISLTLSFFSKQRLALLTASTCKQLQPVCQLLLQQRQGLLLGRIRRFFPSGGRYQFRQQTTAVNNLWQLGSCPPRATVAVFLSTELNIVLTDNWIWRCKQTHHHHHHYQLFSLPLQP